MLHKAWSSIEEVPYCFARSSVKFQGHTALKIVEFDPNWAFPDCNSSLISPMAMKCCTKLETAKERCPIVFQGHPSNFRVTWYKTSPILTQIGHFRTVGWSQLSNPSDLPVTTLKIVCIIIPMYSQEPNVVIAMPFCVFGPSAGLLLIVGRELNSTWLLRYSLIIWWPATHNVTVDGPVSD